MRFTIKRNYLPSKKFVFALSIAIGLILLTIAINYSQSHTFSYKNGSLADTASSNVDINSIDTDHDGLPDWQEVLYGTNPNNPDTDGDGTPDGEEVKEGRDPLKANTAPAGQEPNDKIDPSIIAANEKQLSDYESLNPTDKLARDLFSNIIAVQPVSGTLDQNSMNNLIAQTINDLPQPTFTASTTITDLNLIGIQTDTPKMRKAMDAYETIYLTQTNDLRNILGTEIPIIQSNVSKDVAISTKSIQPIITSYTTIVKALIQMPIPASANTPATIDTLQIVQDIEKLIAIDNDILTPNKDSVSVFSDISVYNTVMNDLIQILDVTDTALGITRY